MNDSIIINKVNNEVVIWEPERWDDYSYEGAVFVIKKDGAWIGIYNMNFVQSIEVRQVGKGFMI